MRFKIFRIFSANLSVKSGIFSVLIENLSGFSENFSAFVETKEILCSQSPGLSLRVRTQISVCSRTTRHGLQPVVLDNLAEISGQGILKADSVLVLRVSAVVQCRGRIGRPLRLPDEQVSHTGTRGFEISNDEIPAPGVQSCGGSHFPF